MAIPEPVSISEASTCAQVQPCSGVDWTLWFCPVWSQQFAATQAMKMPVSSASGDGPFHRGRA